MTDFKHAHSYPHESHRKMLHILLTHLPPTCALTFSPTPQRATSQMVESSRPCKEPKQDGYKPKEEGSQKKLNLKNPRRARTRAKTRTSGTDSPSRSK